MQSSPSSLSLIFKVAPHWIFLKDKLLPGLVFKVVILRPSLLRICPGLPTNGFASTLSAGINRKASIVYRRLSPQGFYDAIRAYGLPEELIRLDVSAQSSVPYYIKTAYGLTDPLLVTGVTKQGGSLSLSPLVFVTIGFLTC
jgi:hypothetical protein